jgi:hypothetical protein
MRKVIRVRHLIGDEARLLPNGIHGRAQASNRQHTAQHRNRSAQIRRAASHTYSANAYVCGSCPASKGLPSIQTKPAGAATLKTIKQKRRGTSGGA